MIPIHRTDGCKSTDFDMFEYFIFRRLMEYNSYWYSWDQIREIYEYL